MRLAIIGTGRSRAYGPLRASGRYKQVSEATPELWERTVVVSRRARAAGALQPVETVCEYRQQAGIRFALRQVVRSVPAPAGRGVGTASVDPFLPYERELYVADLGAEHVALLNKYNVFDNHLLIITRDYEDQEAWLTAADFRALWRCMGAFKAFGFYNGGRTAGASQPHKHLQVVPLPLSEAGPAVPLSALVPRAAQLSEAGVVPELPYLHGVMPIPRQWWQSPRDGAQAAFEGYRSLVQAVGLSAGPISRGQRQSAPYNLLVTAAWMMLVPRRREAFHGVTINSLGLAGAMLARDEEQLALLKQRGPMAALEYVTVPRACE